MHLPLLWDLSQRNLRHAQCTARVGSSKLLHSCFAPIHLPASVQEGTWEAHSSCRHGNGVHSGRRWEQVAGGSLWSTDLWLSSSLRLGIMQPQWCPHKASPKPSLTLKRMHLKFRCCKVSFSTQWIMEANVLAFDGSQKEIVTLLKWSSWWGITP